MRRNYSEAKVAGPIITIILVAEVESVRAMNTEKLEF